MGRKEMRMKVMKHVLVWGLLAAFAGGLIAHNLQAEEQPSRPLPFRGTIKAVDKEAKTITLAERTERVFHITKDTKLSKGGKEATFEDAKVGEQVGGSYRRDAAGKMTAVSIRFGPRVEETPRRSRGAETND
jgi:hypothetical protein